MMSEVDTRALKIEVTRFSKLRVLDLVTQTASLSLAALLLHCIITLLFMI